MQLSNDVRKYEWNIQCFDSQTNSDSNDESLLSVVVLRIRFAKRASKPSVTFGDIQMQGDLIGRTCYPGAQNRSETSPGDRIERRRRRAKQKEQQRGLFLLALHYNMNFARFPPEKGKFDTRLILALSFGSKGSSLFASPASTGIGRPIAGRDGSRASDVPGNPEPPTRHHYCQHYH